MAVTTKLYGQGMLKLATGSIDIDTDTFHLFLSTASDTPNQDTDDFRDDVTSEVAAAGGYSTGGVALGSIVASYDSSSQQARMDCADPAWTFTAATTWRYGHVTKWRGGASSADELLGYLDWGTSQTVSTPYSLTIDPAGLFFWDVT